MSAHRFEDPQLEKALLGHVVSGEADAHGTIGADTTLPLLAPTDFGPLGHQAIVAAAQAARKGGGAGVIAVCAALRDADRLNTAGGEGYVADLPFYALGLGDPVPLVARLKELARARRLVEVAEQVVRLGAGGANAERFVAEGQRRLTEALAGSHVAVDFESAREGLERVFDHATSAEPPLAWSTGLEKLDFALGGGLYPGSLTVVAARPGVGKTSIATQVSYAAAALARVPCLMFSLEMPPLQIWQRVMSGQAHVPHTAIRRHALDPSTHLVKMTDVVEAAGRVPFYIHRRRPGERKPTPDAMVAIARAFKQRFGGLGVLLVDYIQIAVPPGDAPKHERIGEVTMALKDAAVELDCAVVALSQFNRGAANDRPDVSQLLGSGSIESDADNVAMLYRPDPMAPGVELILGKQRSGQVGTVDLRFIDDEVRFEEAA